MFTPDCVLWSPCRTREKINRPQTRRRRDNSDELLDKMRQLKDNLMAARAIMDEVVRRERRKRDLAVRGCLLRCWLLSCMCLHVLACACRTAACVLAAGVCLHISKVQLCFLLS
jgi:hypothetical protein